MSLKDLTTEAMLGVSEHLLNPPADRPQLHDQIEMASSIVILKRAHTELLRLNKEEGLVREKVNALKDELATLNIEHDRASRGLHRALEAAADLTDDPVKSAAYKKLREQLHPTGLAVNQISYIETAGNVLRVSERITPEARELLKSISVDGKTLEPWLDRWFDAGRKVGTLQTQREMLGTDDDPNRVSPALIQEARNTWIRAIEVFRYSLQSTPYTPDQKSAILAALQAAEVRAGRARKKAAETKDAKDAKAKQKADAKEAKAQEKATAKAAKAKQKADAKEAKKNKKNQSQDSPEPNEPHEFIPTIVPDPDPPFTADGTSP